MWCWVRAASPPSPSHTVFLALLCLLPVLTPTTPPPPHPLSPALVCSAGACSSPSPTHCRWMQCCVRAACPPTPTSPTCLVKSLAFYPSHCALRRPPPSPPPPELLPCRDLFQPIPDTLQVDVVLGEGCMPPTVLMVAAPKAGKALLSDKPGMKDYATSVRVDSDCGQGGGEGRGR